MDIVASGGLAWQILLLVHPACSGGCGQGNSLGRVQEVDHVFISI